jgi:hypothetical protein
VIKSLLYFLTIYNETRVHDMLALMLDCRLKSFKLIFYFTGHEHVCMAIIKEYNKKSLFLMLLKSYHHLHPLFKAKSSLAYKNC